jgi:S1-C subfamily serine protease
MRSAVLVYRKDSRGTKSSLGTGAVVHVGERLVVTNCHVVGRETRVGVMFPLYDAKGELITEFSEYEKRLDELLIKGQVLAWDATRDLALIRVDRLSDRAEAVRIADQPAATGATVISAGNSGVEENLLWRLTKGTVRGRSIRQPKIADPDLALHCMILETDAPTNKGDSGGAVVNDHGELVGVVSYGGGREKLVSGNIDLVEVRKFVDAHLPK